jgi:TonB family protein
MGSGELELSSIVAPVDLPDAPQPKPEIKITQTQRVSSDKIILKELYQDISRTTTPPKDISGEKNVINAEQFDKNRLVKGTENVIPETVGGRGGSDQEQSCGFCQLSDDNKKDRVEDKTDEIVVKTTPKPVEKKVPPPVQSLGVINGRATYLATPPYPAAAKAVRADGAVNVQVTIDENGNVISASVVSGHPLLRAVSINAARQSKFTPTFLSKVPVKVTGVIVYKFAQ